jgi:hypothetical protein
MSRSVISSCAGAVSTNARRGLLDALGLRGLEPTGQAAAPVHARAVPTFDVLPGALRLHLLFGFSS